MTVHEVIELMKCLTFMGRHQEKAMKDAMEKPRQALVLKYSFKSIESNLKICHKSPIRKSSLIQFLRKEQKQKF